MESVGGLSAGLALSFRFIQLLQKIQDLIGRALFNNAFVITAQCRCDQCVAVWIR